MGYFGHNDKLNTYIEVISYDKLLVDAKKEIKYCLILFTPKIADIDNWQKNP